MNRWSLALLSLVLAACTGAGPSDASPVDVPEAPHHVLAAIPPYGPASINGHDAGSFPNLALTTRALPRCDGGPSTTYVQTDGGPPVCGTISGGSGAACDAGIYIGGASPLCLAVPIPTPAIAAEGAVSGESMVFGSNWGPGYVAIDAGTTGQLPESRLTACGSEYQVLTQGASAVACGAVNLSQTAAVTGTLPSGNQAAQTMGGDVTGTTGSSTVAKINGYSASGTPGTGEPLVGTGSAWAPGSVALPYGGTNANLSSCATSQLVEGGSSALSCITLSGDVTYTAGGAVDVVTIGNGIITPGPSTGTLTSASGATAPGLAQASTSGATGANITDAPQASTNANGTPGSRVFNFAAPTGSGMRAGLLLEQAATADVYVGDLPTSGSTQGIWFGSSNVATRTTGTAFAYYDGTDTNLVAPTGSMNFKVGAVVYGSLDYTTGYFFEQYGFLTNGGMQVGSETPEWGGGTSVLGITNGTAPSAACTGGSCVGSTTDSWYVEDPTSTAPSFRVGACSASAAGAECLQTTTQPSGSSSGGPIYTGYQGQAYEFGRQSTSLPLTKTLTGPAYVGTLNATAMTGGGTTAQTVVRLSGRYVCSFASGTNGACAATLDAVPDSISEYISATIVCTTMTANTGDAVGSAISQTSTAVASLAHSSGTVTIVGTPLTTTAIGTTGDTSSAAWTASGTSPVITFTLGTGNLVGARKCTINTDEQFN